MKWCCNRRTATGGWQGDLGGNIAAPGVQTRKKSSTPASVVAAFMSRADTAPRVRVDLECGDDAEATSPLAAGGPCSRAPDLLLVRTRGRFPPSPPRNA